jgi:hypothetical protein
VPVLDLLLSFAARHTARHVVGPFMRGDKEMGHG